MRNHPDRESKAYECDHMRPVVRIGDTWHHIYENGEVMPVLPCSAGVYEVTRILSGDHAIHKMWVGDE